MQDGECANKTALVENAEKYVEESNDVSGIMV